MSFLRRVKFKILRLVCRVRQKLREIEHYFENNPPHPFFGLILVIGGLFLTLLGILMLIFPGPGLLAMAAGIASIVFGVRITTGYYNED